MSRNFLVVDPAERPDVLRALASEVRVAMLKLLHSDGPLNVNDIARKLKQPQSTVSSNMQVLVDAGLVRTETQKARKGNQKICHPLFDEVLVMFKEELTPLKSKAIEVAMPLGLYTSCEVSAPCGLCSTEGIIGLLDVPDTFLDPDRMKAGLIWFTRGYVEYQFPNNARLAQHKITSVEFSMETELGSAGNKRGLAERHHHLGERQGYRHVDVTGGFRRQARGLYARLVEAERQPVRQAQGFPGHR